MAIHTRYPIFLKRARLGLLFGLSFIAPTLASAAVGDIFLKAGSSLGVSGFNDGTDIGALFDAPRGILRAPDGAIYIADQNNHRVRKLMAGIVSTVAGSATSGDGGNGVSHDLNLPTGLAMDTLGRLYISDDGNHKIYQLDLSTGFLYTVAGTGTPAYSSDGTLATAAALGPLGAMAFAPNGDLYYIEESMVRKINASGFIFTVAGASGTWSFNGNGILANTAYLNYPQDILFTPAGDLLIADEVNHSIRKVDTGGFISAIVGSYLSNSSTGDNGPASSATLMAPKAMALSPGGELFISDGAAYVVRMVDSGGTIKTIAGTGVQGNVGNGGIGTSAQIDAVLGLAINGGELILSDTYNQCLRVVAGVASLPSFTPTPTLGGTLTPSPTPVPCPMVMDLSSGNPGVTTIGYTHTVGVGSNGLFLVQVAFSSTAGSVIGGTIAGQALTFFDRKTDATSNLAFETWYRLLPPSGLQSVVINVTGANAVAESVTFFGVDQVTPLRQAQVLGLVSTTNPTHMIYGLQADGAIVAQMAWVAGGANLVGMGPGQTAFSSHTNGFNCHQAGKPITSFTSEPVSYTFDSPATGASYLVEVGRAGCAGPSFTPSPTALGTFTYSPTPPGTFTYSPTRTATPTALPTFTYSPTPPGTFTFSPTITLTVTPLPSFTFSPTASNTQTATGTASFTPTRTSTGSFTQTYSPTASFSPTRTSTGSFTQTYSPTASMTPTGSSTPSATLSPSNTASATATTTGSPSASITLTPAGTFTYTPSATPTASITQTATGTASVTQTRTSTPSVTLTATQTSSPSPSFSPTASATPTATATASFTSTFSPTASVTQTRTSTPSSTLTITGTFSLTPLATATFTPTVSATGTRTATRTATPSATATVSPTATPTRTSTPPTCGILQVASGIGGINGLDLDRQGNLYVAATSKHQILKVTMAGTVTAWSGTNASPGYTDVTRLSALLNSPWGLVLDGGDNIYFSDSGNHVVRRIDAISGMVSTIAGTGISGGAVTYSAQATTLTLNTPKGLAIDSAGNLYIADSANNTLRKLAPGGAMSTLTFTTGVLNAPDGLAVDALGFVYVADAGNRRVRKVGALPGGVITVAGTGALGDAGDGAAATLATFTTPAGLAFAGDGKLYVSDAGTHRVREIALGGNIQAKAGTGTPGLASDYSPALSNLNAPSGLVVDAYGNLAMAESGNTRLIRLVGCVAPFFSRPALPICSYGEALAQGTHLDAGKAGLVPSATAPFLAPNPVQGGAALSLFLPAEARSARLRFYELGGSLRQVVELKAGQNTAIAPTSPGLYLVQIEADYRDRGTGRTLFKLAVVSGRRP